MEEETGKKREEIIDRINKLLEVTQEHGATEAEAVQAALMAQRLIAEHDVGEGELGGTSEKEPIEDVEVKITRRWADNLAVVVAENFRCKAYFMLRPEPGSRRRTRNATFLGYRSDAQAAALVFDRLYRVGTRLANQAVAQERLACPAGYEVNTAAVFNSYALGFIDGVRTELEKQSQALMLVCPAEVEASYLGMGLKRGKKWRGQVASDDADIRQNGRNAGRDAVRAARLGASDRTRELPQ